MQYMGLAQEINNNNNKRLIHQVCMLKVKRPRLNSKYSIVWEFKSSIKGRNHSIIVDCG